MGHQKMTKELRDKLDSRHAVKLMARQKAKSNRSAAAKLGDLLEMEQGDKQ